jgi:hypothetical protein
MCSDFNEHRAGITLAYWLKMEPVVKHRVPAYSLENIYPQKRIAWNWINFASYKEGHGAAKCTAELRLPGRLPSSQPRRSL